ncbi:MAG TPA: hypothetical protein DIU00_12535 [Phycisphaerales bacterium]|nr:hypothetical protein [Phycisphaerales bacterium]
MKKARDIHRLLEKVDLTVNADADREVLEGVLRASRKSTSPVSQGDARRILTGAKLWRFTFWRKAGYLAAALLVVTSWVAFDLRREVTDLKDELELARRDIALARRDVAITPTDDSATINLYLKEHRDVVARHVSQSSAAQEQAQMRVSQHDILYYEFLDDGPEYMRPGIIVRGPSSPRQISSSEAPVISNGHTLSLSEARKTAGFALQAPSRLHPCYELDQIRGIDGRDALQLLYTDGINSVSLFEQSLDGQRGLSRQDFREYAVYRNTEQNGGTILAWKDNALSYVLVGNTEMAQLMNMAQSISAGR